MSKESNFPFLITWHTLGSHLSHITSGIYKTTKTIEQVRSHDGNKLNTGTNI